MPRGPLNSLVHYIGKLAGTPATAALTDADLLRRFVSEQDESAFALLVERHGRLVWSVCRHLLSHEQDVEDAYQATLLVLARKAGSIRNQRSVASFLYGVAYRTALKTRTTIARRQRHERQAEARSPEGPVSEAAMRELQSILDEEVQRLPAKFRAPFVLCCLEGKGKAEAAEDLGWPEGTVSGRVAQARKLLQRRLLRRGIALSAALCALAVGDGVASAVTTAAVVKVALLFAAGKALTAGAVSERAVVIAEAVLRAAGGGRLKLVLAALVLLGLTGTGAGAWFRYAAANRPEEPAFPEDPAPAVVKGEKPADPGGDRPVTVAGHVLGPNGQPVPGARVAVVAVRRQQPGKFNPESTFRRSTLGAGEADNGGGFRLPLAQPEQHTGFVVFASCRGHGMAWQFLRDPGQADVPLRLEPERSLRGRLLDATGTPARGVTVRVAGVGKQVAGDLLQFPEPPENLPAWFQPVVTDEQGGFAFDGLGPDWTVFVTVHDDRFAYQVLTLKTGSREPAEPPTFTLPPAQWVEGRVTAEDTGAPLPGVVLEAGGVGGAPSAFLGRAGTRTDAQGRFRLNPYPVANQTFLVYPPEGSPYLGLTLTLPWPPKPGADIHYTLPRGVRVRGWVVEAGSGKPVAGAVVTSMARVIGNAYLHRPKHDERLRDDHQVATGPDGSFEMNLLPGPTYLLVKAPSADYLHVETTDMQILYGRPGGNRYYPDGLLAVDLKPGAGTHALEPIVLRRGVTLAGSLVGPDGRPAGPGFLLCPTCNAKDYHTNRTPLPTRAGRFEVPGCDPGRSVPVWFFDPENGLGGAERLSVKADGEPVVRLAECGSVTLRLVPPPGVRVTGEVKVELMLALRPPGEAPGPGPTGVGSLVPASAFRGSGRVTQEARAHRLTFSQLIPGASYVLRVDVGDGWVSVKEFAVKPGEQLDLGDVIFPAPPDSGRPPVKT
jgi:RNA polymerase sigma factor (sigma-70 family)